MRPMPSTAWLNRPVRRNYAPQRKYLFALLTGFSVLWLVLALRPWHREDWFVENILVVIFVVGLVVFRRALLFSRISYTLIFVFLSLHSIARITRTRTCPTMRGSRVSRAGRSTRSSDGNETTSTG